jgi:hypothetical protein
MKVCMQSAEDLLVTIRENGFGQWYPPQGVEISKHILLQTPDGEKAERQQMQEGASDEGTSEGRMFACVGTRAEQMYFPLEGQPGVRTMEELSYFICVNKTLLDRSFMKEELALFVRDALGRRELGERLLAARAQGGSLVQFCGMLLSDTAYLEPAEYEACMEELALCEALPRQKRIKLQADSYMERGEYYRACRGYLSALSIKETAEDDALCGEIYMQLGSVYAALFYFGEAAECFRKSYAANPSDEAVKKELLCQCFLLDKEAYRKYASGNRKYFETAMQLYRVYEGMQEKVDAQISLQTHFPLLEQVRDEFKRMSNYAE